MEAAIRLADYFSDHARLAFSYMGAEEVSDNAQAVLAWTVAKDRHDAWRVYSHGGTSRRFEDRDATS